MKAWYSTKRDAPLIDMRIQRRIKKVGFRRKYRPTIPKSGVTSIRDEYWESLEKRKEAMMKIKGRSCVLLDARVAICVRV